MKTAHLVGICLALTLAGCGAGLGASFFAKPSPAGTEYVGCATVIASATASAAPTSVVK